MDGHVAISQAEKSDNFTFAFNMSHWIINTDFLKMHTKKHLKKEAGTRHVFSLTSFKQTQTTLCEQNFVLREGYIKETVLWEDSTIRAHT